MKRNLVASLAILWTLATNAVAADLADTSWTESNIENLRHASKDDVMKFITQVPGVDANIATNRILYFTFADLAGDGRYELLVTNSPGPCCTNLTIYWQDAPGRVRFESLAGGGDPKKTIRDLNGDGKDELILSSYLDSDSYRGATPTPTWPSVYRLQGDEYVEASREFPNFYSDEVLPSLDKEIGKAIAARSSGSLGEAKLAALQMEKDKVLRLLGRDSVAGLSQAREWAKSRNPELVEDAVVVFADIGGCEDELRAAKEALKRTSQPRQAAYQGG